VGLWGERAQRVLGRGNRGRQGRAPVSPLPVAGMAAGVARRQGGAEVEGVSALEGRGGMQVCLVCGGKRRRALAGGGKQRGRRQLAGGRARKGL